jgi:tetratricopeptide (TPR) repeat protein
MEELMTTQTDAPSKCKWAWHVGFWAALAWHYEAAGLSLKAARALHEAGQQAVKLSAYRESLKLFDRGLALLATVPPSPERSGIEQLLRVDRLIPVRSLEGSGSVELAGALAEAIEAGAVTAQDRTRLVTLQAEEDHLIATGQFDAVVEVAEQMLDLAAQLGDEAFMAHAHFWMEFAYNLQGRLPESEDHFQWVLARQALGRWAEHRAAVGYDVTVAALTFSAINQWFLGHPEIALQYSTQAVTGALELGDRYGLAIASSVGSMTLFLLRSDGASLQARGELCCRVCAENGFAWWQYFSEVILGWLAVSEGEAGAGIERTQQSIAAWNATGMVVGADALAVLLADGHLITARRLAAGDEADSAARRHCLLEAGLAAVEAQLGPHVACGQSYQPELHRLKGELLLERDGPVAVDAVLTCFQQSLQLGREMGALAWELRAAMSLVRLRMRQGETHAAELAEARQLLSDLYASFTEGFDFPDLRDAVALIGQAG